LAAALSGRIRRTRRPAAGTVGLAARGRRPVGAHLALQRSRRPVPTEAALVTRSAGGPGRLQCGLDCLRPAGAVAKRLVTRVLGPRASVAPGRPAVTSAASPGRSRRARALVTPGRCRRRRTDIMSRHGIMITTLIAESAPADAAGGRGGASSEEDCDRLPRCTREGERESRSLLSQAFSLYGSLSKWNEAPRAAGPDFNGHRAPPRLHCTRTASRRRIRVAAASESRIPVPPYTDPEAHPSRHPGLHPRPSTRLGCAAVRVASHGQAAT
jgi:hypothetical protein